MDTASVPGECGLIAYAYSLHYSGCHQILDSLAQLLQTLGERVPRKSGGNACVFGKAGAVQAGATKGHCDTSQKRE